MSSNKVKDFSTFYTTLPGSVITPTLEQAGDMFTWMTAELFLCISAHSGTGIGWVLPHL